RPRPGPRIPLFRELASETKRNCSIPFPPCLRRYGPRRRRSIRRAGRSGVGLAGVFEVRQHGQDPAVLFVVRWQVELCEYVANVLLHPPPAAPTAAGGALVR